MNTIASGAGVLQSPQTYSCRAPNVNTHSTQQGTCPTLQFPQACLGLLLLGVEKCVDRNPAFLRRVIVNDYCDHIISKHGIAAQAPACSEQRSCPTLGGTEDVQI